MAVDEFEGFFFVFFYNFGMMTFLLVVSRSVSGASQCNNFVFILSLKYLIIPISSLHYLLHCTCPVEEHLFISSYYFS